MWQVVLLASEYTKSIDVWSVGCAGPGPARKLQQRGDWRFKHQGFNSDFMGCDYLYKWEIVVLVVFVGGNG